MTIAAFRVLFALRFDLHVTYSLKGRCLCSRDMKKEHNERVGETITVTNTQAVLFPVILKITYH
jgi:hypothetical protein